MIEIVNKKLAPEAAFADFETIVLDGHQALNQWGQFWGQNQRVANLGYPSMTPFARLVAPSRGGEWDDMGVMSLEVEHVDQLIKRQSLLVIEAARCYYILHRGESIRDGADSLGRKVGGVVAATRFNELLRIAKYVVGMGRVVDGFV